MKTKLRFMSAVLVVLSSPFAFAAENEVVDVAEPEEEEFKLQVCRPTIACMAELTPPGYFQVEMGYGGRMGRQFASSAQLLLMYTIIPHLQVQLGTNNVFLAGQGIVPRAFDGVMPGVKWLINDQGKYLPSNAISAHLMMPTHAFDDASQKTFDLQVWWYLSKDIAFMHADINVMLSVYDLGGTPTPQGLSTIALAFDLTHGFTFFTELYSTWGNAQAVPLDGGSLNGIAFSPIDELVFDIGGDIGLYPGTRAFSVFAGVTFAPLRKNGTPLVRAKRISGNAVAMAQ